MKNKILFTIAIITCLLSGSYVLASKLGSSETSKPTSGDTLKNGLVGWWTFDGADVNATQVLDKSVSGNSGTRTAVTPTVGKIGQAMYFNGSSSKIALSLTPTLTYPLSISVWAKFAPGVTGLPHFLGLNTGNYPILYWIASTKQMAFYGAGNGYQYSGVVANPQAWHLYTIVVPSTSASLIDMYIDGVKNEGATVSTDVMAVPGASWFIGGNTNIFFGKMDDFRIYNRAISPAEVTALYKYGQTKVASSQTAKPTAGDTLKNGLVGWWTMDGADVSATQALDKSGNNNTGTRTGGTVVAGKIGQAMKFSGTSKIDTGSDVIGTGADSICTWGYWKSFGGGNSGRIVDNGKIIFTASANVLGFSSDSSLANVSSDAFILFNKWYFVCVTRDASGVANFYVNGLQNGTPNQDSHTPVAGTGNVFIGNVSTGIRGFDGYMDDVRIYSRVLSATEVKALYKLGQEKIGSSLQNKPTSGDSLRNGLAGWWTFDGKDLSTTVVSDKSGNASNGTRTGGKVTPGKMGQGISFNGNATDGIIVGQPATLELPVMTWSLWINYKPSTALKAIISKTKFGPVDGVFLRENGLGSLRVDSYNTDANTMDLSVSLTKGVWTYITVTLDNTNGVGKLYKNGVLVPGAAGTDTSMSWGNNSTANWSIGTNYGVAGLEVWNGGIDDVRIYNRILSQSEITALYNQGK